MNAFLLFPDRDLDLNRPLPPNAEALELDLGLPLLFDTMAQGDAHLRQTARHVVLDWLVDPATIRYRQAMLADSLARPGVVRALHATAVSAVEGEKQIHRTFWETPDSILARAVEVLAFFADRLRQLRRIADEDGPGFASAGFARFFAMLRQELDDAFFARVDRHLEDLRLRGGVLVSATLGQGLRGTGYVVRAPRRQGWLERLGVPSADGCSFRIADRDESGFRALADLRGRGIDLAADALARSADHVLAFFALLRAELAFYVGALNLHERLAAAGTPLCVPVPAPLGEPRFAAEDLRDAGLALRTERPVVGNDAAADDCRLVVVTGANQGGKSTFLRSVGLAQLMMQAGLFVAARSFRADVASGVFTHFKREEDASLRSGKLDEELARMSDIADRLSPNGLILFNESFAATNEMEGSAIARQVVRALVESRVKVFFVTHQFAFADGLRRDAPFPVAFLRADRTAAGDRPYRLVVGDPLPTSFGADTYRVVFGRPPEADTVAVAPV